MSLAVLADHMASKGRGGDSMLIHMSPREVQGLQALAMAHGGSLTINPDTGLPEALSLGKLLPAILGFAVTAATGLPAWQVGLGIGAVETARTGDLGRGIQAGLGAYGGAGLGANLGTAGSEAIGSQAAGQSYLASAPSALADAGAGLSADMAYNLTNAGVTDTVAANAAQQAAAERVAAASPFEKLSAGAEKVAANPMSFANKDNLKYLAAAAGPAIMAGENVRAKGPQTVTKPGMIRPYAFDPYGGTYTAGTPYEAAPAKAAEGGLMGMAGGGYSPGMLDFTQKSEPVVRMAKGGIASFAIGGDTKSALEAAYAANDVAKINDIVAQNKITAEDVGNTWQGLDTSGLQGLQLYTPSAQQAAPTYTSYTPEQIGSYLTANPTADIAAATKATNADPNAVNAYLASLDNPFRGSTDTTGGSGTLGIYNQMKTLGVDPNELYAANLAVSPNNAGWSAADIARGYNLDKGAYALTDQIARDKIAADAKLGYDKQWAKFMDDNNYSVNDMAQAFGLSKNEVQRRYDAAKAVTKTKVDTLVGGTGNDTLVGGTGNDTLVGGGRNDSVPSGFYGNTTNPGDITRNTDGTVTVHPNIPYRPVGGFSGMEEVRNAYTEGGGRLGYIPYAPKTMEEFEAKYNTLTGGSKQAYDYLTGKTKYTPTPYTETGEVMKPYAESVLGVPANISSKRMLFDPSTKTYKLNPDYVPVSYTDKGKKVYGLSSRDIAAQLSDTATSDYEKWATENNVTLAQVAEALGISLAEAKKRYPKLGGTTTASTTATESAAGSTTNIDTGGPGGGEANGGLMKLAGGGMAGKFDLGGYSDGGRLLRGPGDGVSDSIPATIGNKRPARLADGEFVVPARIVSELGNGSTEAGARKLYAMMDRVQAARRGTVGKGRVAKNSRADKHLPA